VLLAGDKCLWQAGLFIPRIKRKVKDRNSGVAQTVGNFGTQQAPVGADINPEAFFRRIIYDLVRDLWTQQRLAAHQSEHAATAIMQPIDGALGNVLRHTLHCVVEGPAIPAVEIALVIQKEIRRDGMELARHNPRSHVGHKPAADFARNLSIRPIALLGWYFRAGVFE
jgi:hypothetical protein